MNVERESRLARLRFLAFASAVLSSLLYYGLSDGFRFLIRAVLNGGRNVMVGA
jgi:hypothetical protein